jgi:signal transduction histidine kinase
MIGSLIRRSTIAVAAWLPFFALWVLFAASFSRDRFTSILSGSVVSMGSAGLLGIAVWHLCRRWPWPRQFSVSFYVLQLFFGLLYALVWSIAVDLLESARRLSFSPVIWSWPSVSRQLLLGIWLYAICAGVCYAVQTRRRLHEKELQAAQAEALAASARLDAIRARLNPHFLFNALHTLSALVKFRPEAAEPAIQRLGDMLRYALKENGRELVEFAEEYDFTRQYLAFEQLRYEDRLKVHLQSDPEASDFDLPPFSIQTLAENAVHHAISVRPEGGSIWIKCIRRDGQLRISVRDDGPGVSQDNGESTGFGLRSLRERLRSAFGNSVDLRVTQGPEGFEACFAVPLMAENIPLKSEPVAKRI